VILGAEHHGQRIPVGQRAHRGGGRRRGLRRAEGAGVAAAAGADETVEPREQGVQRVHDAGAPQHAVAVAGHPVGLVIDGAFGRHQIQIVQTEIGHDPGDGADVGAPLGPDADDGQAGCRHGAPGRISVFQGVRLDQPVEHELGLPVLDDIAGAVPAHAGFAALHMHQDRTVGPPVGDGRHGRGGAAGAG